MNEWSTLKVRHMMTHDVISMRSDDPLSRARRAMADARIRHIPVVDLQRRVIGMVSDRDLLRALAQGAPHDQILGQFMTRDVHCVRPDLAAHEATALMIEHKIGSLPVVDDHRVLVGMITETDVLLVAHQALIGSEHPGVIS